MNILFTFNLNYSDIVHDQAFYELFHKNFESAQFITVVVVT